MYKLVLIRHGESIWNKENRFTGWTDVDLSETGVQEAMEAGKVLKNAGYHFEVAYTSYLTRAIRTLWLIQQEMDLLWIPVYKSWRLNEKHYGLLQGLNKSEMAEKYGEEQVLIWRRSYDIAPPPIEENDTRHPRFDHRYAHLAPMDIPATESLKDTVNRIVPYWTEEMSGKLREHKQLIVAAHGNSLRGIVKYLKKMTDQEILGFNLPTGVPLIYEMDEQFNVVKDYYLGDPEEIRLKIEKVANQGKKKS
ncbi:MAG: 2,3-diphosphoglycerate-dependent phosphoglycerate mutase [Bacteroidota bacterium]